MVIKNNKYCMNKLGLILICCTSSSLLTISYVLPISVLASSLHSRHFIIAKTPDERQPEAVEKGIEQIPAVQAPVSQQRKQPIESPLPPITTPTATGTTTATPSTPTATGTTPAPKPATTTPSTPTATTSTPTPKPATPSTPTASGTAPAPKPATATPSTPTATTSTPVPKPVTATPSTPTATGTTPAPKPVTATPSTPTATTSTPTTKPVTPSTPTATGTIPAPKPVTATPSTPTATGTTPAPKPATATPSTPTATTNTPTTKPVTATPSTPTATTNTRTPKPVATGSSSTPTATGTTPVPKPTTTTPFTSTVIRTTPTPKPSGRLSTSPRQRGRQSVSGGSPISTSITPTFREINFVDIAFGVLAPGDYQSQGRHFHFYQFEGRENQLIQIRLTGSADQRRSNNLSLNPFLFLLDSNNQVLLKRGTGGGVDSRGVKDAFIFVRLPAKGTYTIAVTSQNPREKGRYSLALRNDRASYTLDQSSDLTLKNSTLRQNGSPYNVSKFQGKKDQLVSIRADSIFEQFSPYVVLLNSKGQIVASDSDKDGKYSALIDRARLPADDTYYIVVISANAQERGTYRLTVF